MTTRSNYAYSFDTDSKTSCADNFTNCHVLNELYVFEVDRKPNPKERKVRIEIVGDSSILVTMKTGG